MTQTRILFICHGNICRSPAARFVFEHLAKERRLNAQADSAAVSYEEIGNPVYPPMAAALRRRGIPFGSHAARRTEKNDYGRYDLILAMDRDNIARLIRIYGGDPEHKIALLMKSCGEDRDVEDPWYTRDFDGALEDIVRGCTALADRLEGRKNL